MINSDGGLSSSFTLNTISSSNKSQCCFSLGRFSLWFVTTTWPQLPWDYHEHIKPQVLNLQSLLQKLLLSQISGVFHSKYSLNFIPGTLPPHCFPWVWWDVVWKQLAAGPTCSQLKSHWNSRVGGRDWSSGREWWTTYNNMEAFLLQLLRKPHNKDNWTGKGTAVLMQYPRSLQWHGNYIPWNQASTLQSFPKESIRCIIKILISKGMRERGGRPEYWPKKCSVANVADWWSIMHLEVRLN